MKAVISVIGKDAVGILAKVSAICAESNANVTEVTQSVLQDVFAMVMLVDIANSKVDFTVLKENLSKEGARLGVEITICHEQIFNSMHRI